MVKLVFQKTEMVNGKILFYFELLIVFFLALIFDLSVLHENAAFSIIELSTVLCFRKNLTWSSVIMTKKIPML